MIIELLLISSCIFLILVFFYKQYSKECTILQINYSKLDKLSELLLEKQPIIVQDIQVPHCILPSTLLKIERFSTLLLGSCTLNDYCNDIPCSIEVSDAFQIFLADETGFNSFIEHTWRSYLYTYSLSEYISSFTSKIVFGSQYFIKTGAITTLFMPIRGTYICSIINPEYVLEHYKQYNSIEHIQTTTQKHIQYIDIIIKTGKTLLLPPHWYILLKESDMNSYMGIVEYHEPMSVLNNYLQKT